MEPRPDTSKSAYCGLFPNQTTTMNQKKIFLIAVLVLTTLLTITIVRRVIPSQKEAESALESEGYRSLTLLNKTWDGTYMFQGRSPKGELVWVAYNN